MSRGGISTKTHINDRNLPPLRVASDPVCIAPRRADENHAAVKDDGVDPSANFRRPPNGCAAGGKVDDGWIRPCKQTQRRLPILAGGRAQTRDP